MNQNQLAKPTLESLSMLSVKEGKTGTTHKVMIKKDYIATFGNSGWSSNEQRRQYNAYRKEQHSQLQIALMAKLELSGHKAGTVRTFKNKNFNVTFVHPDNQQVKTPKSQSRQPSLESFSIEELQAQLDKMLLQSA